MTTGDEARPFAGMEVVEFGQFIAVPYCGQLLADGGAHVIKIEPLEGDPVRRISPLAPGESRHFISRNRGKHSLPLDLKHPAAARIIAALVGRADVVLTNLRPGLAGELGLEAEMLLARHPRLVVGNVTGFGRRGPDATLAAMDLVMQARSGLMASAGRLHDGVPVPTDPPIADYMCAMSLAFGVASALVRRASTGHGGAVEVSLLMAALTLQNNAMMRVERVDVPIHTEALDRLSRLRAEGAPLEEQLVIAPTIRSPAMIEVYYRTYATRDAALGVACGSPGLRRTFIRALGLEDPALEHPLADRDAEARHYAELSRTVEAVVASRTTAEWKAVLDAAGVPAAGVKIPIEMLDDEQTLANGMLHDVPHPALGPIRVAGTPVRLDGDGFENSPVTPAFGSEARQILGGLGFSEKEVEAFVADGVTRERYA